MKGQHTPPQHQAGRQTTPWARLCNEHWRNKSMRNRAAEAKRADPAHTWTRTARRPQLREQRKGYSVHATPPTPRRGGAELSLTQERIEHPKLRIHVHSPLSLPKLKRSFEHSKRARSDLCVSTAGF